MLHRALFSCLSSAVPPSGCEFCVELTLQKSRIDPSSSGSGCVPARLSEGVRRHNFPCLSLGSIVTRGGYCSPAIISPGRFRTGGVLLLQRATIRQQFSLARMCVRRVAFAHVSRLRMLLHSEHSKQLQSAPRVV